MENLLFLGVPILKHIRVYNFGLSECNRVIKLEQCNMKTYGQSIIGAPDKAGISRIIRR